MSEQYVRKLQGEIGHHIGRGKSILLLGPRQTGKTTLLSAFPANLHLNLIRTDERIRYERDPSLLVREVDALGLEKPLIFVDEVQLVPKLLDIAQFLIDEAKAQFLFSGSSARKLRRQGGVNLLPGRVVSLRLDPLAISEVGRQELDPLLYYGSLPAIISQQESRDKEVDLRSYVETYLTEEIRAEALTRDVGQFSRFLEVAGIESGKILNHSKIARDIGVSQKTILSYFEILEDCLIVERIEPITESVSRKRLTRSAKYLFFDMGVRRVAAKEGIDVTPERKGALLEQMVGLELIRAMRLNQANARLRFWRDPSGPEVDWVIEADRQFTPIEVKLTESPSHKDSRHLEVFLDEHPNSSTGYLITRSPRSVQISKRVLAIPWQDISKIVV